MLTSVGWVFAIAFGLGLVLSATCQPEFSGVDLQDYAPCSYLPNSVALTLTTIVLWAWFLFFIVGPVTLLLSILTEAGYWK